MLLVVSCKQTENDTSAKVFPVGDTAEWLNTDENFSAKNRQGNNSENSPDTIFTLYNDLNNDGTRDTAIAISFAKSQHTEIHFSCFKPLILNDYLTELQITDAGDLNEDGKHEILILQEGSESCWNNLKLYSFNGVWSEKYSGMTYQCVEKPMYQFTKLNDKTIQMITYGYSKDSVDVVSGDTLEQVLPNQQMVHIIRW